MSWFDPIIKWIVGDELHARSRAYRSMTKVQVATPKDQEGDEGGNMTGAEIGGVCWPVDPSRHDGLAFLSSASFTSFYNAQAKTVHMLDEIAPAAAGSSVLPKFHTGADALVVGKNVELAQDYAKDTIGITVRTAKFGTDGLYRNVFFGIKDAVGLTSVALVAHHLNPNPNVNSTPVYDPQEGSGNAPAIGGPGSQGTLIRKGFLDDQFVVTGYNKKNRPWAAECPGQTVVPPTYPEPDPKGEWAVMWNCSASGVAPDRGYGMAYFTGQPAYMAHGASGPLRAASKKHGIAKTVDGIMRSGALDCNAYFTTGAETFDAPLDFEQQEEPPFTDPDGIVHRVHLQMDSDECHYHILGPRYGKWRWHVKIPVVKMPACTPTQPGEDPVLYQFDMGGNMPSPTYHLGFMMGAGFAGLPPPGIHRLAR